MRAYIQNSFIVKTLVYIIVLQLIIGALPQQLLAANDKERIPPLILHIPVKTAIQGENIIITAVLADQSGIKDAQLKFKKQGSKKFTSLDMHKISDKGIIEIMITADKANIYNEANEKSRMILKAFKKEKYFTVEGKPVNGFYHIEITDKKNGWVAVDKVKPIITGDIYLGMIPYTETYTNYITYQLKAEDVYDNFINTPKFKIVLTKKKKEKKKEKAHHVQKSSFWGSTWFWGGLVALSAGTAYYFKNKNMKKEKKGNLNFEISW